MHRSMKTAALLSAALVAGVLCGTWSSSVSAKPEAPPAGKASADLRSEAAPAYDPSKKKPGETCKESTECQPHHHCIKVGDKSVCQAPPRPQLPPGAVT